MIVTFILQSGLPSRGTPPQEATLDVEAVPRSGDRVVLPSCYEGIVTTVVHDYSHARRQVRVYLIRP